MDPIAQYTPREMLAAMKQFARPTSFLQDMFVKQRVKSTKTILEIDKVLGSQMAAAYVDRQGGPNVVGKNGKETLLHVAPYVYEQVRYTPSDIDTRDAGSTVYDNNTDIISQLMNSALMDLDSRMVRTEERQLAEALQTGVVTVAGKGVNYTVDFFQKASHIKDVSVSAPWSTTGNPLSTLEAWCEQIDNTSAPGAGVVIGDRLAMNALIKDPEVLELLDTTNYNIGEINISLNREQRATFLGTLKGVGMHLDLYSYQGIYETVVGESIVQNPYMLPKRVILASKEMDTRFHYGKIENFNANFVGTRFPNVVAPEDGKNRFITMESSPLVGLHQPDAVISAVVLP